MSNTLTLASLDTAFKNIAATGYPTKLTTYRFVATANQSTFTGADAGGNTLAYQVGYIQVYVQGRLLSPIDFTAGNGTSIVLASSLNAGDEVLISSIGVYSVANALSITSQSLTPSQQDQTRVNIGGSVPGTVTTSATLTLFDIDRDQYATGTLTLTMPNGGTGWRSGVVLNDNTTTGLITLAVPTGATLDGTTNGTLILFPRQRARIRQIGTTAYRTDWVDRSPILAIQAVASSSAVASIDLAIPVGYSSFEVFGTEINVTVNTAGLAFRVSYDGGATVKTDASYVLGYASGTNSVSGGSAGGQTVGGLSVAGLSSSGYLPLQTKFTFYPGGGSLAAATNYPSAIGQTFYVDNSPAYHIDNFGVAYYGSTARVNLIRFFANNSGNLFGRFILRGIA